MRQMGYQDGKPFDVSVASIGGGFYLRADAAQAAKAMLDAAEADGVTLRINTAFRTMAQQKILWGKKERGELTSAVAKPGHSTHQYGLSWDINTNSDPKAAKWLAANRARFGFVCDVKTEAWHNTYKPEQIANFNPFWLDDKEVKNA